MERVREAREMAQVIAKSMARTHFSVSVSFRQVLFFG